MDITLIVSAMASISIFLSVIELIRRNRLKERYALLWLFSSIVMLWFSLSRKSLHFIASLIGIQYPPSLMFLLASFFLIVINIHFSMVISELSDKNKTLAQEIALLKKSLGSDDSGKT